MSAVLTPSQLIAALEKWHVPFVEEDGWKTRGRPRSTGAFGDMHGIVNHHTATPHTSKASAVNRLLRVGRSDLPGPLAQFGTQRNGKVALIAHGRANHAGAVRAAVRKAFLADKVVKRPLTTLGETVDGNAFLYGNEVHHDGHGGYTDAQLLSIVLLNAALCDAHGWTANSAAQHFTITRRKVDMAKIAGKKRNPDGLNMDRWLRREVALALKAGPGKYELPGTTPPAPPAPIVLPELAGPVILIVHPNGSAYHLTTKGLVWIPRGTVTMTGPVSTIQCDQATWDRYRKAYPIV